jgi:hypothetical protein
VRTMSDQGGRRRYRHILEIVRTIVSAAAAGKKLAHKLDRVSWVRRRFFNDDGSYKSPVDKWYSEHVGDVPILGTWLDPKRTQPIKPMTEERGV